MPLLSPERCVPAAVQGEGFSSVCRLYALKPWKVVPPLIQRTSPPVSLGFSLGLVNGLCHSARLVQGAVRRCICTKYDYCMGSPYKKSLIKNPFILLQAVLMPSCTRSIFQAR